MKRVLTYPMVTVIVIALASMLGTGCGKNVMGPTAPTALVAQQVGGSHIASADSVSLPGMEDGTVEAACHGKGGGKKWGEHHFRHYQGLFNYGQVKRWTMFLIREWFQDPELITTVDNILSSRLFFIVTFKCGVGPLMFLESLKILAETWFPGLGTNPAQCTAEITLLPYRWDPNSGFYGAFLSEWGNGRNYHLTSFTPKNDKIEMFTGSSINNIYQNQKPIDIISWEYNFIANAINNPTGVDKSLVLSFANMYPEDRLILFPFNAQFFQRGDEKVIANEVWASTKNKSARCLIVSQDTNLLNMDLQFDATGAGGGTVAVRNWRGFVDQYVFVVKANGHGYYTKNGGKKHNF